MPGKRFCNSVIAAPIVAALISTSSSLLVSLRRGVGIRTYPAINSLLCGELLGLVHQRLELAQARLDLARVAAMAVDGVQCLEAVAGDADDDRIFRGNFSRGNEFLGHAHGHAARSLGENTLGLGE